MSLPTSQNRGVVKERAGHAAVVDIPVPALRPGYMLVQTRAVALNPADWTDVDHSDYCGCVVGVDYAGVVVLQGEQIIKSFRPGDRVAGVAHGCNSVQPSDGAFAKYILVKGDMQMHIPDSMGFERAASLGVGTLTAGMGLYFEMGLPLPDPQSEAPARSGRLSWILIYGGSSATGSIAIQLAKLSGLNVVTTCSPHNFSLVQGLGADAVFDYRDPQISSLISSTTGDSLVYALDTIATDETAAICVSSFTRNERAEATGSRKEAIYACALDPSMPSATPMPVQKRFFLGYTLWGEDFIFEGEEFRASKETYDFAVKFSSIVEKLLDQGKLKNHPVTVDVQGKDLEGITEGLKLMREGKVSGTKLVYTIM